MLLSVKGVGQVTFTSSTSTICAGDNAYTITFKNTVSNQLFFYIESSNKNQNNWSTVVSTQTLNSLNNYTLSSSPLIFTSKDFRVKYSTSTDSEGNLVAPTTSSLITIDVNPNTSITTQPTGYSVCAGGTSTALSVIATGTGTITYQWFSNTTNTNSGGTLIGSATNASYSPSVSTANTYYYYVQATSSCSSATSNAVSVVVNPKPTVTATVSPSSGAVCLGSTAILTGFGASIYSWSGGVTNATGFIPTATTTYILTGTDTKGCVNTDTKTITVNPLPAAPTANSVTTNYNGLEQTTPDLIPPTGQSISWFTSSVGGVSSTKPKGTNADTYNSYASATIAATGCISSSRILIYLTINKAPLTITAKDTTRAYGTANPTLTYTYSGLVNEERATFKWPDINTIAVPNSPPGTYPIIPSAAIDPNYTITYVNGTLTVTKAPLTITAKPHTITYNGTAYTGGNGVEPTGFAAGESISNLTGTLNYIGTSQGSKNVGTYIIKPDGLSSPNYNIIYAEGSLEIKKATLNVIAGDQSVNFGTPAAKILNDAVNTYSGLVGGDNTSDITGSVTYTTNYTPLTSTGASGIYIEPIITGLSNSNYDIIAVNGTITITAPPASPVFQIPNAFTPNSDGHNDTFKIIQNGYVTSIISFRVFTKSGKLIFSDKDGAWDGRYGGVMLDADVYIWIADFINKNNVTEHLSGTVLLLK